MLRSIKSFYSSKRINYKTILIFSFLTFIIFYFVNLQTYNVFSTDYNLRYKPNGINLIDLIINLKFNEINILNSYLIPELVTGMLLYITPNEEYFSILSNLLNIFLLFSSFGFFFKSLISNNKKNIILIFLFTFFLYVANWQWCFWKLADIYFLFIFSLVFYFTIQIIKKKKLKYFIYAFIFSLISLFTKPQGIICLPFLFLGLVNLYNFKKFNYLELLLILFFLYFLLFPIFIYFLVAFNPQNFLKVLVNFMSKGYISATVFYSYDDFINQFLFEKNKFTEIIYYYFLFLKKIIYQITLIRETYSLNHNIFLIFYCLSIYGCIIYNFNILEKKDDIFSNLTILANLLSVLLHSSLNTADEPNRHQLFNLVPLYILSSISFLKFKRNTFL